MSMRVLCWGKKVISHGTMSTDRRLAIVTFLTMTRCPDWLVSVNRFANEAEGFVVVCARHDKAISSEQAMARIISPWDGVRGKTRFDRTRKFSEPQGESLTWHGGNAEHSDGDIDASCYQNLGGPLFSDGM